MYASAGLKNIWKGQRCIEIYHKDAAKRDQPVTRKDTKVDPKLDPEVA